MDEDVLVVLLLIGVPAMAVVGLAAVVAIVLWSRVRRLEARVATLEARPEVPAIDLRPEVPLDVTDPTVVAPPPDVAQVRAAAEARAARAAPSPPKPRRWTAPSPDRILTWVGAGLGGLVLLLGLLFGLQAAVEADLLPPAVRVAGGAVLGLGLWGLGEVTRARTPWLGAALRGTGVAALYGALWAGTSLYALWSPGLGFGALAVVALVGLAEAARTGERLVGYLAAIGGLLAPVLIQTSDPSVAGFSVWLLVLATGIAGASWRRDWPDLLGLASAAIGLLSLAAYDDLGSPNVWGWGAYGALLLVVPPALVAWFAGERRWLGRVAGLAAGASAVLVVPWVEEVADPQVLWIVPGLLLAPAAGWWVARRVGAWAALPATMSASLGLVVVGVAFSGASVPWWAVAALPLATIATSSALAWGSKTPGWALDGVVFLACVPLFQAFDRAGITWWVPVAYLAFVASVLAGFRSPGPARGLWLQISTAFAFGVYAVGDDVDGSAVAWGVVIVGMAGALIVGWGAVALARPAQRGWAAAVAGAAALGAAPGVVGAWTGGDLPGGGWIVLLLGLHVLAVLTVLERRGLGTTGVGAGAGLAMALFLLVAAVPLQLQDRWSIPALALEVTALAWATRRRPSAVLVGFTVLIAAPITLMLLTPDARNWVRVEEGFPLFNQGLWTWGVPAVAYALAAMGLQRGALGDRRLVRAWAAALGVASVVLGFFWINGEVSHTFQAAGRITWDDVGVVPGMVRSIAWAAYGLGIVAFGVRRASWPIRLGGFGVVVLGAVKVLAFDLDALSGLARAGSAVGVGVALLAAAWLVERLVPRGDGGT